MLFFLKKSFLLINAANVYLFIIVFDAIYMSLPLHVLCSKIEITKIHLVYSHVSRDFARFLVFNLGTLVENLLVCYVLYSSHVRSKTLKYFSVYLPSITVHETCQFI